MIYKLVTAFVITIIMEGCATYHLSTESLLSQMVNSNQETKKIILLAPPFFMPFEVSGNSLRTIKVLDKSDRELTIKITNHTGIRIKKKDGTKKTFNFNTLQVRDSFIIGKMDHFIGVDIMPINLNNIAKIELQK